ncbi:MAG: lytic transglycosylase domain-containing protein, partial [Verrucomicrobia bacterium]|nr:lytic transglycosylase domain-containing protein [Verrucomicrobiota bacterium]
MERRWLWLLVAIILFDLAALRWWFRQRGDNRFDSSIRREARHNGIDPALVKAVIWQESRFNAAARGLAGEIGLMQIRSLAAEEWAQAEGLPFYSHRKLLDPDANIRAGAWYLGKLLRRYPGADDPLPYALADYNAGRTHVLRWMTGAAKTNSTAFLSQMDFPGTRRYIQSVRQRYAFYRKSFPPDSPG